MFLDRLEGTVIALGPEGQAPHKKSPWKILLLILVVPLLPLFIFTAIAMRIMGIGGQGNSMSHNLLLLNVYNLFRTPPEPIPIWDVRIRDRLGQEHAVRLEGRDASGAPTPGDFVVLWGRIQHGTMAVELGFNERTRSWMYL